MGRRGWIVGGGTAGALLLGALYRFPPDRFPVYPACPFHQATGLLCPGCGATRALAALLHGRLEQAWHLNALFVLLLPFALGYAAVALRRELGGNTWPVVRPTVIYGLLGAALAFTVLRNLSVG